MSSELEILPSPSRSNRRKTSRSSDSLGEEAAEGVGGLGFERILRGRLNFRDLLENHLGDFETVAAAAMEV